MKLMMAQNMKLVSILESSIHGKKEAAGIKSPGGRKVKSRGAFANSARKLDTTRMKIAPLCLRTSIFARIGTMNRMLWGLGVVT